MYVDLHIHTNASDGTWTTAELLTRVINNNISLFSITDHDTIENSQRIWDHLSNYPGKYVNGVEISCTHQGKEYHITAYAFDHQHPGLLRLLHTNRQVRKDHNQNTIRLLTRQYPQLSVAKFMEYHYDHSRGGWGSLNYLIDEGVIGSLSEYFQLVGGLQAPPQFTDPSHVIETVQAAGGAAFLAHPHAYDEGKPMPIPSLEMWMNFGMSGFECFSSKGSLEEAEGFVKFCHNHHLQISAGSDCHGAFLPKALGDPRVTWEMITLNFV